ncbi:hypothetical protein J4E86_005185 [Alternaria arbusti]|uniref:uncharacterized protein n=1 Tax=Alternaria arbusti TaxID=232088 RepID=UPI00221EBBA9|nr:uncharacterized protein J4E86_005185 [Alternaria arbusti]KAI4956715.1 hypothetical protein J4E86_005185 [Alternaria arbusti]
MSSRIVGNDPKTFTDNFAIEELYKAVLRFQRNVLNWSREIGLDMNVEEAGDIGKQGLPDLPGWVLGEEIKRSKHGDDWLQWSK